LQLPQARYAEADAVQAFNAALLEHASKLPGVLSAGIGGGAPPQIGMIFGQLRIQGAAEQPTDVSYLSGTLISPGFLESVGARFIQGDDFRPGAEDEVIVNRAFAERFWPDGDAVGRFIKLGPADDDPW